HVLFDDGMPIGREGVAQITRRGMAMRMERLLRISYLDDVEGPIGERARYLTVAPAVCVDSDLRYQATVADRVDTIEETLGQQRGVQLNDANRLLGLETLIGRTVFLADLHHPNPVHQHDVPGMGIDNL